MTLVVSDAETLQQRLESDPWVKQAMREGIARGIPGVEANMVHILGVTAVRRLASFRSLSSAVNLDYELWVPEEERVSLKLNAASVSDSAASVATGLTTALEEAGVPVAVESALVPLPEVLKVASATTTTLTTTTTTYTSAVASMVGSLSFEVSSFTAETAAAAAEGALESVLELPAVTVKIDETRRLAISDTVAWVASYSTVVRPLEAVELVFKALAAKDDIRNSLIDNFVLLGGDRPSLASELKLRSFEEPRFTFMAGLPIENACGVGFCASRVGSEVRPNAPLLLCEALPCAEAASACCQDALAEPAPAEQTLAMGLIAAIAAGGLFVVSVLVIFAGLLWRRLKQQALKKATGGNSKVMDTKQLAALSKLQNLVPQDGSAGGLDKLGPKSSRTPLRLDGDEKVVALLLNDLQGEWRLYDGEKALPGVIEIREEGYALYDGVHWEDQDIRTDATCVFRSDGWRVNMIQSDTDYLEWQKDRESIVWRRFKGISNFSIGDTVKWERGYNDVLQGTVIGFTDTRVRIEMPEGDLHDAKPSDLEIVEKAAGEAEQPAIGSAARTLPSLSLCLEFKRLSLYADVISRENTRLLTENTGLRTELTGNSMHLSRENTRLKAQLNASRELQQELTNTLGASRENTELNLGNRQLREQVSSGSAAGDDSRLAKQLRLMGSGATDAGSPAATPRRLDSGAGSQRGQRVSVGDVPMWTTTNNFFGYDEYLDDDEDNDGGAPSRSASRARNGDEDDEEAWVGI